MKTEIEAKFLDIQIDGLRSQLKELGAMMVYPEGLTRQKVFDFPDFSLDKQSSWLRLREENGEVTLTLKKWTKEGIEGMKETAFKADSFENAEQLLLAIGLKVKSSQMKKRELWKLGNTEFMIDTWPWIPTFIEIEGQSEEEVKVIAGKLGYDWKEAMFGGVARIYAKYFAIENEEIDRCPVIEFSETPEWLEKKRISK
ncbi:MAG: class IV adenylate cyclase [Patescibacteria group bacterium]